MKLSDLDYYQSQEKVSWPVAFARLALMLLIVFIPWAIIISLLALVGILD